MHQAADVLVPLEIEVQIQGKPYAVRKLGLSQVLKIAHFANTLQAAIKDRIIAAEGTADMLSILETLAERELIQLVEIILNVRGPEHREALSKINVEELSDLIVAFSEVNDVNKLALNFHKIASKMKGLLNKSVTPSARSSEK